MGLNIIFLSVHEFQEVNRQLTVDHLQRLVLMHSSLNSELQLHIIRLSTKDYCLIGHLSRLRNQNQDFLLGHLFYEQQ